MKLHFLADTFFPLTGGAETVLHNLATRLTNQGDEVTVLAPWVRGRDNQQQANYEVRRYTKPSSKHIGVRQLMLPLMWQMWRQPFDVLHCHSAYPPAYVGAEFKRWFGVPIVVRPHGSDILPLERICRHPRLAARVRSALAQADAVVAQGEFLRGVLLELGVPDRLIHVINNGVDLDAFAHGEPFPHPKPYILGLGNLIPRKGFDLLLRAFASIPAVDIDVLIAGDGPERVALEQLADELNVTARVRFVGHVSGQTKVNIYRSALFSVCPSRSEPFANVVLEALASGIPVVASAVGGNTELIRHGEHGLLFQSENVTALAEILRSLIREPHLLSDLRSRVGSFVRRFDWSSVALQYRDLYHRVLTSRSNDTRAA